MMANAAVGVPKSAARMVAGRLFTVCVLCGCTREEGSITTAASSVPAHAVPAVAPACSSGALSELIATPLGLPQTWSAARASSCGGPYDPLDGVLACVTASGVKLSIVSTPDTRVTARYSEDGSAIVGVRYSTVFSRQHSCVAAGVGIPQQERCDRVACIRDH